MGVKSEDIAVEFSKNNETLYLKKNELDEYALIYDGKDEVQILDRLALINMCSEDPLQVNRAFDKSLIPVKPGQPCIFNYPIKWEDKNTTVRLCVLWLNGPDMFSYESKWVEVIMSIIESV